MASNFWDGLWSGEHPVKDLYPRLFCLSSNKDGRVADMGAWENDIWRWKIGWRRALRDSEKESETNLLNFLHDFKLTVGTTDRFRWRGKGGNTYTVKAAHSEIKRVSNSLVSGAEVSGRLGSV